jgi:predicted RNA-binding Zn ribbon-like protein
MAPEAGSLMIRVTWEWLGQHPALDIANTVAIIDGDEHDLIPTVGEYERWAAAEALALGLDDEESAALARARKQLLALRPAVRAVIAAAAAGRELPRAASAELNGASRAAPEWLELDPGTGELRRGGRGRDADRLVATYARAAMELVAARSTVDVRRCPAPSCGMFYRPGRSDQHWCSPQCGSRARVARHYRAHRSAGQSRRRGKQPRESG